MSLPSKKRKLSDEASLPPIDVPSPKPQPDEAKPRKNSGASATSDDTAAMALKAISALDAHHSRHPIKKRKASLDSGNSMESDLALGLAPIGSAEQQAGEQKSAASATDDATPPKSNKGSSTALDHLDALGESDAASMGSKQKAAKQVELTIGGEGSDGVLASSNQRVMLDALLSSQNATARRDRLESWGGMSDLSATGFGGAAAADSRLDNALGDAAAALAKTALHYTGLIETQSDGTGAAHHHRHRTGSIGSLSSGEHNNPVSRAFADRKFSVGDFSFPSGGTDRKMSVGDFSMYSSSDGQVAVAPQIQAFVDAAMATVGDQLEDLAGAVEMAAFGAGDGGSVSSEIRRHHEADSDVSSTVSPPLIGGVTDFSAARRKPRSLSTSSRPLSVDYDAVAAAVNAAQAATGAIDLSTITESVSASAPPPVPSVVVSANDSDLDRKPAAEPTKDLVARQARARRAAGYVPPGNNSNDGTPEPRPPLKKRPKQPTPEKTPGEEALFPDAVESTPRVANTSNALGDGPMPETVSSAPPKMQSAMSCSVSNKKWDDMFAHLVKFAEDKKAEAFKQLSKEDQKDWVWDGNVPTTFKTPDGKSLGRWVNNQRTSKSKGTLRQDREDRLISTGLRWSQLAATSWNDMMNELRAYVEEKTKNGEEWDGNVPATYKIKQKAGMGEDKNLGRWVNRQRSNRQSGKLQKDREEALTALGLRWSVLPSTTWDDMYEVLREYAEEQKKLDPEDGWDGNVPSTYKTKHNPPKALGRWVNRQRSNYSKKKIKKDQIEKLSRLGLKWAVHGERARYVPTSNVVVKTTASNETAASSSVDDSPEKKEAPARKAPSKVVSGENKKRKVIRTKPKAKSVAV